MRGSMLVSAIGAAIVLGGCELPSAGRIEAEGNALEPGDVGGVEPGAPVLPGQAGSRLLPAVRPVLGGCVPAAPGTPARPAPAAPPAFDAVIEPGTSVQSVVDAHPEGAIFLIAAGRHTGQQIRPKDRQSFIGEPGAVLDGRDRTAHAFQGDASGVRIQGLTIQHYANRAQTGAIDGARSDGWVVEDNVVQENEGIGIRIGDRMIVRNNRVLRNDQLGIGGSGHGVLIEGNEIAYNNHSAEYRWGWEAGGSKFTRTTGLIVRGNHVYRNHGPGLWTDIDNVDALYEDNVVEDNVGPGIFHEISYRAIIRNNTVRRNGREIREPMAGAAGILISASRDVEVVGNLVEDNGGGIVAMQQRRGSGPRGEYRVENLWVHGNRVAWSRGYTGVVRDDHRDEIFSTHHTNNRFDRNVYEVDSRSARRWAWGGRPRGWREWRDSGHDAGGALR